MASEKSRVADWISGRLKIKGHVIDRARQRLNEKFGGITRKRACKMIERAVRHPNGEVEGIDEISGGAFMVAVPFYEVRNTGIGDLLGYLAVARDKDCPSHVVVVTLLEPWMIDAQKRRRARQQFTFEKMPRWWRIFTDNPDEPKPEDIKRAGS